MTVLLLTATAAEQAEVAGRMADSVLQSRHGRSWRRGQLAGVPVWLIETGIGLVNTAHALASALAMDLPDLVIHFGVGGAYPGSGLGLGDIGVADEEIYGELGVRTTLGWQGAELIGIPTVRLGDAEDYYNRFPAVADLVRATVRTLDRDGPWAGAKPVIKAGPFVTVQECSGTRALGDERGRRFGAICENMEGAASAHICALEGIPFVEVRGISNLVEDRDRERWELGTASARAQEAVVALLEARSVGGLT